MAIITTYPFKNAPLSKDDEIIISDSKSNNPNFKTKSTDINAISQFVIQGGTFEFVQSVASDTWVVEHNLDKFPSVTVADSQPEPRTVIGNITYNTRNKCTITFSAPFSGKAFCN
tara:strand:+ start:736 stop:1080 length:345 start_codon:yes stop_codon:yes gene_type:complete